MSYPGVHQNFEWSNYSSEEIKIIERLSKEWYITSGSRPINLSETSIYRGLLARPTDQYQQMFNMEREVIVLFSNYVEFEARTIDGFDAFAERWRALRIDPICRILISKDQKIVDRIKGILKNDPELPVIVPFTYEELLVNKDTNLISNRFRQHFFSRDLFAFESPLKRDTYFFGRTDLINNILARHGSNENSAVFGLRRSGKTSIVFGLERACKINQFTFISIDCQSPSVHKRRWNELLLYIIENIISKYQIKQNIIDRTRYGELEYIMLSALAIGDLETFNAFNEDPALTNHLRGYGLIEKGLEG